MFIHQLLISLNMRTRTFLVIASLMVLTGCSWDRNGTFNSEELVSGQQEKIYINTLNWGITDDQQISAVSGNRNRLLEKADTLNTVKGLEPFIYTFKKDTLNLYFDGQVNYHMKEKFKTIQVNLISLDKKEYAKNREKAYKNDDGYCTVPKQKKTEYPSDMPKPPGN